MGRYFITGTDTGVGKTVLSMFLMRYLFNKGYNPFYIKPFQTGCNHSKDTDSDAWFVYRNVKDLECSNPDDSMVYCFKKPLAPLFAARDEKKLDSININCIKETVSNKEKIYGQLIIEGAGGILVPITEDKLVIDYMKELEVKTLVAARAGLGTINHTLLTINNLKAKAIEIEGVVLLKSEANQASNKAILENTEAIEKFSGVSVLGVVDYVNDFSNPDIYFPDIFDKIKFT